MGQVKVPVILKYELQTKRCVYSILLADVYFEDEKDKISNTKPHDEINP